MWEEQEATNGQNELLNDDQEYREQQVVDSKVTIIKPINGHNWMHRTNSRQMWKIIRTMKS